MDGAAATQRQVAGLTRTLAEQASSVSYEALPEPVRALARQCALDYYGVALAGKEDPLVDILLAELGEAGGAAQASIIGHKAWLPALSAALVNGAIGHALDYDDVNLAMPGHPSVAILPSLLALAEQRQSSGREVVAAFVAGYETACRIGSALRPGHYDRGFHATGTVGCLGAATACARLLGLDAEATARGFSSRPDLVECEQGFALTHGPDFRPEAALADPPNGFHIFANLFKYHAACYLTHGPIECARKLREQQGVMPDQATDPRLVRLREKLVLDFHDNWPQAAAELEVTLADGRVLRASHDAGVPSADIAAQGERLAAKFDALAGPALGAARARELRETILGLDTLADVGTLTRLAAG